MPFDGIIYCPYDFTFFLLKPSHFIRVSLFPNKDGWPHTSLPNTDICLLSSVLVLALEYSTQGN